MTQITREQFINQMQNNSIDLNSLPPELKQKAIQMGADKNNDGKIEGREELSRFFAALDSFDDNGDRHSIRTQHRGKTTTAGRYLHQVRQSSRSQNLNDWKMPDILKNLNTLPNNAAKEQYLMRELGLNQDQAKTVLSWLQMDPHPSNPNNPQAFKNVVEQVKQGTYVPPRLVGNITETEQHLNLQLSDGRRIPLPKYGENSGPNGSSTRYYYPSISSPDGKAWLKGGITPATDAKIRKFLDNLTQKIEQKQREIANLSGGKKTAAQDELQRLQNLANFGITVFLHQEAMQRRVGGSSDLEVCLNSFRFQFGENADLTDVNMMDKLSIIGNRYTTRQWMLSPELYKGMGSVPR